MVSACSSSEIVNRPLASVSSETTSSSACTVAPAIGVLEVEVEVLAVVVDGERRAGRRVVDRVGPALDLGDQERLELLALVRDRRRRSP